jgi:hypothetical protein
VDSTSLASGLLLVAYEVADVVHKTSGCHAGVIVVTFLALEVREKALNVLIHEIQLPGYT